MSAPDIPARIVNGIHIELDAIHAADLTDRNAAMAVAEAKQRAFEAKCRCGELLLEAKGIWGKYGKWRAWLKDNFSLSYKTADEWMEYVTYRDRIIEAAPPEPEAAADDATDDPTPEQAAAAAEQVAADADANEKRASHFTWRGLKAIITKEKEKDGEDYVPKKPPRRAVTAKKPKPIEELLAVLAPDEVFKALRDAKYSRAYLNELGKLIVEYLDGDDFAEAEEERPMAS
jgi:hypothetical protein